MDQVKGSTDEGGSREPYGPRDGFDEAHERRDARDRPGTTLDLKGILLDHKKTMGTTLMQLRCLYVVLALLAFFVPWPRNMGLSRTALYESLRSFQASSGTTTLQDSVATMHDAVKYFFDNMAAQLDSSELRYDESLVTNAWVVADNVRIVNYAVVIDAQTQCDVDLGFGHRACETDPTSAAWPFASSKWLDVDYKPEGRKVKMYRVYNSVSTTLSDASDAVTELSTASTLIAQYAPTVWHLLVVQDGNDADHVYMCVVRIDMMAGSQQFGYTPTIYVIIYPVFLKPWSFRNIAAMAVEVAFCVMVLGYMFAEVNCMRLLMRMPARGGGQQTRRKTQRYHPLLIYWFSLVNLLEWVSLLGSLVYLVFTWLSTVLLHPDRSKMADADWVLTQPQLEKIWAAGVLGTLFWTQLINLVIIGLLLLRYMFVHKGAQVILHMFQYALVPLKDVALFIVYISCVIGVALYGMYGSSGANSMFNSLSASLHSVLKLTFGFLSYEDFIKEPGLGRFNFLAAAAFWFCTLVLVIICQNIILAIVASCYEQARAEVGEENESFAFYFLHHFYCCCVVWARLYLLFQTRDSICRQYLRKLQSTEPYQVDPVMRNVVITMCIPEMRTLFLYCADTTGHVRYRAPILEAFQKCGGEGLYSSSYGSSTAGDLPPLDPKTMLAVFCAVFDTSGDEGSHFVNSTCKFRQLPTMRRPFLVPDDKRLVEIVGILFDAYSPEHAAGASGGGGDGSVDAYGGYKGGSSADRAAPAAAVALHARGGGLPWSTNAGSRKQHTRVHPDDGAKQKQ